MDLKLFKDGQEVIELHDLEVVIGEDGQKHVQLTDEQARAVAEALNLQIDNVVLTNH